MTSERFFTRLTVALIALVPALAACEAPDSWEEAACPPQGTQLTYENFGKGFMLNQCNQCHSRHLEERHGATEGYSFDTHEDVIEWREHIYERSAGENDSMPPGPDDPPLEEREKLKEWLACGAP